MLAAAYLSVIAFAAVTIAARISDMRRNQAQAALY
jgi:hypothetical protein